MFSSGYLTIGRWRGTPIRVHWSAPIGMLVLGRFAFVPGYWLGFAILVIGHELGHAYLARRMGLRPLSADMHAFGGWCRLAGEVTPWRSAVVAWGGVLAQALILAGALLVSAFVVMPDAFSAQLLSALIYTNLWMIAFNLVPIEPLDGAEAWKIVRLWRERQARRRVRKAHRAIEVRARVDRVRSSEAGGPAARLDVGEVDEEEVREIVRRALDDAARQSRGAAKKPSP